MILKDVQFGPYVDVAEVEIQASRYVRGGVALRMVDNETGEVLVTMTVSLDEAPADGAFWLKSWGENDGLMLFLGSRGLVEYTGRTQRTGYVDAIEARPKGALWDLVQKG